MKSTSKLVITVLLLLTMSIIVGIKGYYVVTWLVWDAIHEIVEDTYTVNNSTDFEPKNIKRYLYVEEATPFKGPLDTVSFINENEVFTIPVPAEMSTFYNYEDTVFSKSGDYYISTVYMDKESEVKEVTKTTKYLGKSKPVVIEIQFPTYHTVLYIQCYTTKMLNYFTSHPFTTSNISRTKLEYDIREASKDEGNKLNVKDLVVDNVPKDILDICDKYTEDKSGALNFYEEGNWQFNYHMAGGTPYEILCEYKLKMESMDTFALKSYDDKTNYSLTFEDLVIVVKPLTLNTCLVYNFSKLQN